VFVDRHVLRKKSVFPRLHRLWLVRVVRQVFVHRHVLRKKSEFPRLHRLCLLRVVRQVFVDRHVLRKKSVFPRLHRLWLLRVVCQVFVDRHVLRKKSVFQRLHRRWLLRVVRQVVVHHHALRVIVKLLQRLRLLRGQALLLHVQLLRARVVPPALRLVLLLFDLVRLHVLPLCVHGQQLLLRLSVRALQPAQRLALRQPLHHGSLHVLPACVIRLRPLRERRRSQFLRRTVVPEA
jgi:hypothetical protein